MIDDLTPVLRDLPEPAPPSSITATVMARIAREADRQADPAAASVQPGRERAAWLWTFAGVALVLGVTTYGWISTGSLPDITSARIGLGRPSLMPLEGPVSVLVGVGLLVYLAGLFAPLRSNKTCPSRDIGNTVFRRHR